MLSVIIAAGLAAYFLSAPVEPPVSTRAFLESSAIEIRVLIPGRVEYAAKAGQPVSAGEVVLKMNTAEYEKSATEAESIVSRQAGAVPQRSRNLMLRYLAIPQSEAELAEYVRKAAEAEKESRNTLAELSERQAMFNLELRRLELKRERLAEEEARMEAMRVEEDLLRGSLKTADEEFEDSSMARASAEKMLQTKRDLGKALRSLPSAEREQLYALEAEFSKMYEAEQQIELSNLTSPKNGRVMYAALAAGDEAAENELALYILPDDNQDVWVTAYFSPRSAGKMQLGADCAVTIDAATPLILPGIVAEKMPDVEQGPNGELPFKVRFSSLEAAELAGISPKHPVSVSLKN